jgi:hypothetical protein
MTGNSGQVSRALRTEFPADPARHVVHEMICQAVCRPELGGLSRELPASVLRTRGRRRKPQRRTGECHASGRFHRRVRDVPRWVAPSVATTAWASSSAEPPRLHGAAPACGTGSGPALFNRRHHVSRTTPGFAARRSSALDPGWLAMPWSGAQTNLRSATLQPGGFRLLQPDRPENVLMRGYRRGLSGLYRSSIAAR